jgi:hypothetical protein
MNATERAWGRFLSEHNVVWFYEEDGMEIGHIIFRNGFWLPELRTVVSVRGIDNCVSDDELYALASEATAAGVVVILAELPIGRFFRIVSNGNLSNRVTFDCCESCARWRFIFIDENQTCPACGHVRCALNGYAARVSPREPAKLKDWASRLDVAHKILSVCGMCSKPPLGKVFHCPLPGHTDSAQSASLFRMDDGTIHLRDWHKRSGQDWFTLSEVYASFKIGKVVMLKKGQTATWFLRALVETGFMVLPVLDYPQLPNDAPRVVRKVYDGFTLVQRLQRLYDANQGFTIPYSVRFASEWSGCSQRWACYSIKWLSERGYLTLAKEANKAKHKARYFTLTPTGNVI